MRVPEEQLWISFQFTPLVYPLAGETHYFRPFSIIAFIYFDKYDDNHKSGHPTDVSSSWKHYLYFITHLLVLNCVICKHELGKNNWTTVLTSSHNFISITLVRQVKALRKEQPFLRSDMKNWRIFSKFTSETRWEEKWKW